ncbi:Hypothetical predicted protein [Podarcis lilfordi]|uniref:Uncharacterized protein n=1 Tax=Podarcis lilfordi TaxID=74358 RepID=A0AA35KZW5_9SAUR|nr:Hypothetical predicted protein [Podarcis lilfordi]
MASLLNREKKIYLSLYKTVTPGSYQWLALRSERCLGCQCHPRCLFVLEPEYLKMEKQLGHGRGQLSEDKWPGNS